MAGEGGIKAWPVIKVEERELRIFSPQSNIALCVNHGLATGKNPDLLAEFTQQLPKEALDKVHAAGVLTVIDRGVQLLLANVLTNPKIDTLILAGRETLFKPSTALLLLKENGFDPTTREISGYSDKIPLGQKNRPFVGAVPDQALALYRSGITVIDARLVNQPLDQYFAQLAVLIEQHYKPRPELRPLGDFDFSSLQPEQRTLTRYPETTTTSLPFQVFREQNNVWVQAQQGSETIALVASDQDSMVHGLNAWAIENNLHQHPSDDGWFKLGLVLSQAFLGNCPPGTPALNARVIKAHVRKLELDPVGYFEVGSDPLQRLVKCMYVPADPKGKRFELIAKPDANSPWDLLRYEQQHKLLAGYSNYPGRIGHLVYLAAELDKAFASAQEGYVYVQDKAIQTSFKINTTQVYGPAYVSAPALPDLWRSVMYHLERDGRHSYDKEKGEVSEGWCTLWHTSLNAVKLPDDFDFFDVKTADLYAQSLFEPNAGEEGYTYGDRQCHFFGYDQVQRAIEHLKERPNRAVVCQRYYSPIDIVKRHGLPCLLGESYFLHNGKLQVVHVTRAHDMFRAFSENLYGVSHSWADKISRQLNVPSGDLLGLSMNNNYRKGADRQNVETLMRKLTAEPPRYPSPELTPRLERIQSLDQLQNTLVILPTGPHVLGLHFPNPAMLDGLPPADSWPHWSRLKACKPFNLSDRQPLDQITAVSQWIKEKPTDNGIVLSPRDPILDRDQDASNLVFIQPRIHLGKLMLSAFSVNTVVGSDPLAIAHHNPNRESPGLQYQILHDIHQQIAQASGFPMGELFVLHAPLYREG